MESSNVRAVASANIGGAFAIHDIQVMDSQNGLFVYTILHLKP